MTLSNPDLNFKTLTCNTKPSQDPTKSRLSNHAEAEWFQSRDEAKASKKNCKTCLESTHVPQELYYIYELYKMYTRSSAVAKRPRDASCLPAIVTCEMVAVVHLRPCLQHLACCSVNSRQWHIGSESRFLPTAPAFNAPVRGVPVGISPPRLVPKN